jgi:hypothetical protein
MAASVASAHARAAEQCRQPNEVDVPQTLSQVMETNLAMLYIAGHTAPINQRNALPVCARDSTKDERDREGEGEEKEGQGGEQQVPLLVRNTFTSGNEAVSNEEEEVPLLVEEEVPLLVDEAPLVPASRDKSNKPALLRCVCVCVCTCVCVCVCVYVCVCICMYVCMYIYVHTYVHTYVPYIYIYIYICLHTYYIY